MLPDANCTVQRMHKPAQAGLMKAKQLRTEGNFYVSSACCY